MSDADVEQFVAQVSNDRIQKLFSKYKTSSYGHLMDYPITDRSIQEKRMALTRFLSKNLKEPEFYDQDENERVFRTRAILYQKEDLEDVFYCDQFWQEPLYRVLNEM